MASCAIHLKSKAYFIASQEHKYNLKISSNKDEQFDFNILRRLQQLGIEISPERNILKLSKEFAEHDYYGYASLIFFVNHHKMESDVLDIIYKNIKRNSTLKYVTKLVLNYVLDESRAPPHHTHIYYKKGHPFPANSVQYVVREWGFLRTCFEGPCTEHCEKSFEIMRERVEKKNPFIENLIVLTFVGLMDTIMHSRLEEFMDIIAFSCNENSIQKLADTLTEDDIKRNKELVLIKAFSSAQFYIYNINPALAIVINHYSFSDKINLKRVGSEIDIAALKRLFRIMKISYYITDDASSENVQAIVQKVQTLEFIGIKYFYIFIMSHGEEGDIIYSKTESYSIKDEIVIPLLENSTLADVQKFFIVNACRGKIAYDLFGYYEAQDQEKIQKLLCEPMSPIYPQNEKLMMIYSTQRGYQSMRWEKDGSIFVQKLCESMAPDFDEKSMEAFLQETKKEICVHQIPDFQIDEHQPHIIKMEFTNLFSNQDLLDDIFKFFKTHISADGTQLDNELYKIRLKQFNEEV